MKLTDLYLEEIRHHLPPKNKDDILKEIQSTLLDMIEDRKTHPGQPADEEAIKAVLKEFGAPREVAAQYGAKNYLIGPRLFPIYLQVLRIVLIVIGALNVLGMIVAIVSQSGMDAGLFDTIAQILGGLLTSLFTGFGIVTLSFASIERTTPEEWTIKTDQEWEPDQLLKHEDVQRVKYVELAFEITFTLIFIVLLNFFLDSIGIYYFADNRWISAPILNENFLRYVPWLTAANVLSIALNLFLIRQGYWDKRATIAKLFINALTIAINFATIVGPEVITVTPTAWQNLNFDTGATAQEVTRGMNIGLDILLSLSIFGVVVESVKMIYTNFIKGIGAKIEFHAD